MAVVAAVLLFAGIAFSFVGTGNGSCCAAPCASACDAAAEQTCCDMPCPPDGCLIGCCEE